MPINVNCKHCADFGKCNIQKNFLGFRIECIEYGTNKTCSIADRYPRPDIPKPMRRIPTSSDNPKNV